MRTKFDCFKNIAKINVIKNNFDKKSFQLSELIIEFKNAQILCNAIFINYFVKGFLNKTEEGYNFKDRDPIYYKELQRVYNAYYRDLVRYRDNKNNKARLQSIKSNPIIIAAKNLLAANGYKLIIDIS